MAKQYVQRQFSGFLGVGDSTDPVTVDPSTVAWTSVDINPSNILKIEPGLYSSETAVIAGDEAETLTVGLPASYDSDDRLSFTLRTDQNLRVTVVSPDHPTSTVLVYAPTDGYGFYSVVETVTSISIVSLGGDDTTVEYACFSYPDLTLAASWRDGDQTIGVVES